jgi:hypothetical protein
MTLAEATAYLRLPEADVISAVQTQGLSGRFIGIEWRFLKSAIRAWLSLIGPIQESRKAAQLALVGKYKDDPDLLNICKEAYRQRARTRAEDE